LKQLLLAGDIGGTKTWLSLGELSRQGFSCLLEKQFASGDFRSFEDLLSEFLNEQPGPIATACFGVAGPVEEGKCRTTNLPWVLSEKELANLLPGAKVKLLNDLEAAAHGIVCLPENQLVALNPNARAKASANRAVIAAGTGLGEALIIRHENNDIIVATEGGHCDFAPNSPLQDRLLAKLRNELEGHVSYERLVSGPGLAVIYRFLRDEGIAPENPQLAAAMMERDPSPLISEWGLEKDDRLCLEALRMFASLYGAEAGNLVLKSLALGGVYLAGGIAPKILPVLRQGDFMRGFCDKGRFGKMLAQVPVQVVINPKIVLEGAKQRALQLVDGNAGASLS